MCSLLPFHLFPRLNANFKNRKNLSHYRFVAKSIKAFLEAWGAGDEERMKDEVRG
jgi:hypothetical protein